ncbi:MAG: YHS domain-containing (seleno)protein [Arenibacterium sp.]
MPMSFIKRAALSVKSLLMALTVAAAPAFAGQGILNTVDGIAMDGFDVMSYHLAFRPAKGSPEFSAEYRGATWLFSSAENRDKFMSDPAKYEPKYNGWCSMAVAKGYSAEVDFVEGWAVIDGNLHLAWAESTMNKFLAEQNINRVRADDNWVGKIRDGMGTDAVRFVRHEELFDRFPISHPQPLPEHSKY